jgi:hypothetical protein
MPKYGTNAKAPSGAKSSDAGGERTERLNNGVGMGKADGAGRAGGGKEKGEYNTGRTGGTVYRHTRPDYPAKDY